MNELKFWAKFLGLCIVLGMLVFFTVMKAAIRGGNVDVPDLKGMAGANATIALQKLGLQMEVMEERFNAEVPYGSVLDQDTEPGMTVKRGRTIRVVISQGTRLVQVPELVGMRSQRQARLLLEQNGLKAGVVAELNHAAPEGNVISQSPEGGLEVPRGSRVSLLVSKGKEKSAWVMPSLKGQELNAARNRLKSMGLVIKQVALVDKVEVEPGSVIAQSLTPGARVEEGDTLDLSVARGDPATTKARYALLQYQVPDVGVAEKRVQIVILDARGRRVVYNAMEKPGADVQVETKAWGTANYVVYLSGDQQLEQEIP